MTAEWATLASAFERRCLRWAVQQLGSPYIWGGKGDLVFDRVKGLRAWQQDELRRGRAYDCSGLVTCAVRETTTFDARGRWSASVLRVGGGRPVPRAAPILRPRRQGPRGLRVAPARPLG